MKTALITGGAGFLGSHLCDRLIHTHHIICVDNLITGKHQNIAHLFNHPNFTFIQHDIIHPLHFPNRKIHHIYNLACPAAPIHYQHNPIRTIKTNILGTINTLGIAKKHQARILQASTSEIYGDPLQHPQTETYNGNVNPIGIRSCYDEGKRCAETLLFDYHRRHNIQIRLIRIFNTYGPRMSTEDGRVVSNFIHQALQGHHITAYGDGTQTRSFCYVDDLIEGIIKHMNHPNHTGPINLGNPHEFTILQLAQQIIQLTNTQSTITFKPLPQDDPQRRKPDIQLAKKHLNWQPKTNLHDGLKTTITHLQKTLQNHNHNHNQHNP